MMESYTKEITENIERIISSFIRELHSTVDTKMDILGIDGKGIKGDNKVLELITTSNFFNIEDQELEKEIIKNLNDTLRYTNDNLDENEETKNEESKFESDINYCNYLFLSQPNEKIVFEFTFQGFENSVIEVYKKGSSYSFLRFMLDKVFEEIRSGKIASILDGKVYENKTNSLSVFLREFTKELVNNICESTTNNLYSELNYISSLNYEGSIISAKLMILNKENIENFISFFVKFSEKISYTEHRKIRKILEISDDNMYLIGDNEFVYGIGRATEFGKIKELEKEDKILVVDFISKFQFSLKLISTSKEIIGEVEENYEDIRWWWNEVNCVQVKYEQPILQENQFSEKSLSKELKRVFKDYFEEKNYFSGDIEDSVLKISKLVQYATKQKHGTMLIISKPELALAEINRLKNQSIGIIKTDLTLGSSKNKLSNIVEKITGIDGAIYLDIDGFCYAIGVILDGVAKQGQGDTSRGARYNSAIKYYNSEDVKGNCIIVIISEDGMIDVLPDSKKEKQESNRIINEIKSLIRSRELEEALTMTEQLKDFSDSSIIEEMYGLRGIIFKRLRKYTESLNKFNEAIKINPKNSKHYNNRGNVHVNLKEYEKAIESFTQAIDLESNKALYYYNRGNIYAVMKSYNKSLKDFDEAIKLDDGVWRYYNNRGNVYGILKELEKACDNYFQAIKINSGAHHVHEKLNNLLNELIDKFPEKEEKYRVIMEEVEKLTSNDF